MGLNQNEVSVLLIKLLTISSGFNIPVISAPVSKIFSKYSSTTSSYPFFRTSDLYRSWSENESILILFQHDSSCIETSFSLVFQHSW